ncbi:hypothetical protein JXQ70_06850 [bacterium]|nr:hypothetical protein [bacterium]
MTDQIHPALYPHDRHNILVLMLMYIALFLLFFGPRLNSDSAHYFEYVHSIAHDGDIHFWNERALYSPRYMPVFPGLNHKKTGFPINIFTIGPALTWLPGQLAINFLANSFSSFSDETALNTSYSLASLYNATVTSSLLLFLALILLYRLLRYYFSADCSLLTVLIIVFTTNVPAFAFITPAFAHNTGFFCVTCFLYSWLVVYREGDRAPTVLFVIVGASLGLLMTQRLQGLFFSSVPIMHVVSVLLERLRNRGDTNVVGLIGRYCIAGLTACLFFLPQLVSQLTIFGSPLADPQGEHGMHWADPSIWIVLFHQTRGLFVVNPVYLLAFLGLFFLFKRDRLLFFLFGITIAIQLYINMVRRDWCGVGFGMRRIIESIPFLAFGFASLLSFLEKKWGRSRILKTGVIIIIALLSLWNFLLMAQYYYGKYGDPGETLSMSFHQLVRNQFDEAPEYLMHFFDSAYPFWAVLRCIKNGAWLQSASIMLILIVTISLFFLFGHTVAQLGRHSRIVPICLGFAAFYLVGLSIYLFPNPSPQRTIVPLQLSELTAQQHQINTGPMLQIDKKDIYPGESSYLLFGPAGIFLRKAYWEYSMSPFLSHGKLNFQDRFLAPGHQELDIHLRPVQNVKSLDLVYGLENIPPDIQQPLLRIELIPENEKKQVLFLGSADLERSDTIVLPLNWKLPAHPETGRSFWFEPPAEQVVCRQISLPLPETLTVHTITIKPVFDRGLLTLHGLALGIE